MHNVYIIKKDFTDVFQALQLIVIVKYGTVE